MRVVGPACLIALLAGCGGSGHNNGVSSDANSMANWETARIEEPQAPITDEAPAQNASAEAPTKDWLAGRWQAEDSGPCEEGGGYLTLEAGGRYAVAEEEGRWSLEGDVLTFEVTRESSDSGTAAGQRHSTKVRPLGQDEAVWQSEGQPPIRMRRCSN